MRITEVLERFFFFIDEFANITFGESFGIIITEMMDRTCAIFQPTEEQMELFSEMFMGRLPEYLSRSLARTVQTA